MISYERKKHITSREGKGERNNIEERTVKAMPVTVSTHLNYYHPLPPSTSF
jgi:hypothetical protein